jgi:hypothetical protein
LDACMCEAFLENNKGFSIDVQDDVLHARVRTTGIVETEFRYEVCIPPQSNYHRWSRSIFFNK